MVSTVLWLFLYALLLSVDCVGQTPPPSLQKKETDAAIRRLTEIEKEAVVLTDGPAIPGYLTVEDCILLALQKNFDIREAEKQIERERGIVLQARSLILPKLALTGNYEQVDENRLPSFNGQTFGSEKTWRAATELVQPLYTGGEASARYNQETLLRRAAELQLAEVVNRVVSDVKIAFYDVLLARARIDVEEASVELLQQEFEREKSRFGAGAVSNFNVLRAEVAVANARTPLIQARNALRLSLEELTRILAIENPERERVAAPVRVAGALNYQEPVFNLAEALRLAREERPLLAGLRVQQEAQKYGVRAARAGYLPRLELYASYGAENSPFSDSLNEVDRGWLAGARTSWYIFDGLYTRGRVVQAQAEYETAGIQLDRALQAVDLEVRRALSDLVEARELVLASQKVVEQAEESYRLAEARLAAGSAAQIDVLDAQVALTEARTNKIQALYSFNVAESVLQRSVGVHPELREIKERGKL